MKRICYVTSLTYLLLPQYDFGLVTVSRESLLITCSQDNGVGYLGIMFIFRFYLPLYLTCYRGARITPPIDLLKRWFCGLCWFSLKLQLEVFMKKVHYKHILDKIRNEQVRFMCKIAFIILVHGVLFGAWELVHHFFLRQFQGHLEKVFQE